MRLSFELEFNFARKFHLTPISFRLRFSPSILLLLVSSFVIVLRLNFALSNTQQQTAKLEETTLANHCCLAQSSSLSLLFCDCNCALILRCFFFDSSKSNCSLHNKSRELLVFVLAFAVSTLARRSNSASFIFFLRVFNFSFKLAKTRAKLKTRNENLITTNERVFALEFA